MMEKGSNLVRERAARAWERHLSWVPTLYLLRGIPYVAILALVPIVLNRMGVSNAVNLFCCSLALIPFILRPLLGRFSRQLTDCHHLILYAEVLMGLIFLAMGIVLRLKVWLPAFLFLFYAEAFAAAFHDVGIGRYFMICSERRFYQQVPATRAAATCAAFALALGIPAMVGGNLEVIHRRIPMAWSTVCELLGGFILLLAVYHAVVLVPLGEQLVRKRNDYKALLLEDLRKLTDRRYFRFEILFLLLFLLPEGFFYRVGILFLADPGSNGGLSLSPQELAFTQGTVGAFGMLLGCLLGGRCIHLHGFRYWLWPMTLAITLPKVFYVLMAYTLTTSFSLITLSVFLEQFGFGFGIMAFVAYLAHLSRGYHPVMFYSYCFALAAIGITVSGALSGILADYLGYRIYFALLMLLSLTSYLAAAFVRTEPIEGLKL